MSLDKIHSALIQAYVAAFPTLPTAYPNANFKPSTNKWAKIDFSPAQPFTFTLGDGGEDMQRGVLSVSLFYPQDTGTYDFYQDYSTLRGRFTGGKFFTFSGQSVWIRSCGVTAPVSDGAYLRGIVIIEWEATIARPVII